MNPQELTGRTQTHLASNGNPPSLMHPDAFSAFQRMRQAAAADGIDLFAVSAFRDFSRQTAIWNAKWTGQRPLFDRLGQPVNPAHLSPTELAHTILTWSALPGASRHHWGSDFDLIDAAARPEGYQVQLLPEEFFEGGYFHPMHAWLEKHLTTFGFFFPYKTCRGGVAPEPWHISYAPVSVPALKQLTINILRDALQNHPIEGHDLIQDMLPEIHSRYILHIDA